MDGNGWKSGEPILWTGFETFPAFLFMSVHEWFMP